MNVEQKELLTKIMNDKYAAGPFVGMIWNKYRDCINTGNKETVENLIKEALEVRLVAQKLANEPLKAQKTFQGVKQPETIKSQNEANNILTKSRKSRPCETEELDFSGDLE